MNDMLLPADLIVDCQVIGPATVEDLAKIEAQTVPPLKRISERHHALARGLAMGLSVTEAAVSFRYEMQTVSRLQSDPAFMELVTFYRQGEVEVLRTTQERMAEVANEAIEVVHEILNDPEKRSKVSVGQALEVVKTFADRSGNGPQTTSVSVNIHANLADRLKAAREQAANALKDITPKGDAA